MSTQLDIHEFERVRDDSDITGNALFHAQKELVYKTDIPSPAKWTLICLMLDMDNSGRCIVGNQPLVKRTGMSVRSVQRWTKHLVALGWITKTDRYDKFGSREACAYQFKIPKDVEGGENIAAMMDNARRSH